MGGTSRSVEKGYPVKAHSREKQQSHIRAVAGVRGGARDANARGVVRARTRTGEKPVTQTLEVVARAARVLARLEPSGPWRDAHPGRGMKFLFP